MRKIEIEKDALEAYARMINTGGIEPLAPLLSDDFSYSSQAVLTDIQGKAEFLRYMRQKLAVVASREDRPVAEMAYLPAIMNRPCLVLFHRDSGKDICTVLAAVSNGKLNRIDLCFVPTPNSAVRTGEIPE